MILTGKCKEDFLKSIYYKEDTNQVPIEDECNENIFNESKRWLRRQDERFLNALIIEFFDSVGIYIGIVRFNVGSGYFESRIHYNNGVYFTYVTRQEATKQAIIKANEIYNKL